MTFKHVLALSVFTAAAVAAPAFQGGWAISPSREAGSVELMLFRRTERGNMNSSNTWKLNQLSGLSAAQLQAASSPVRFAINREAGRIECTGTLQAGNGGGSFSFTPNPEFPRAMRALGFDGFSDEEIFAMALHDVSTAYVKELKAEGVRIDDKGNLIALRIHGVSAEYAREMKRLGLSDLAADKLIAMRIHGVSTEFAQSLKSLGYQPRPDDLVALRIHGVSADFARSLRTQGYNDVPLDQMVAMRIHGVSPEFMKQVADLGFGHPPIDKLIAMRIHGVTPDFIRRAQSHGLRKLTIDDLVSMRIHGILN